MITNRQVARARWEQNYWGGAEVSCTLVVRGPRPQVFLGGVKHKRRGERWYAWICTPSGERDLGKFRTRGPAKHAIRRTVRSLPPAQRGDGPPSPEAVRRELAPTREVST